MEVSKLAMRILRENHTLIAGTTGCGKTTLLNSVIYAGLVRGNGMFFIDPKRTELYQYKNTARCLGYADSPEETVRLLHHVITLMDKRFKAMRLKHQTETSEADMYVIIDELADLLLSPQGKEIATNIQKLTQLARSSHIHVIAATQQPSKKVLSAAMVLNFTCRVGMACFSAIESRQIIGMNGCEDLPKPNRFDEDQRRKCIVVTGMDPELWWVPYTEPSKIQSMIKGTKAPFWARLMA